MGVFGTGVGGGWWVGGWTGEARPAVAPHRGMVGRAGEYGGRGGSSGVGEGGVLVGWTGVKDGSGQAGR
jgi:hypothetical protein